MINIPQRLQDLVRDEKRAFAALATLKKNGSPHVTPMWFNSDGEYILINSSEGRVKVDNMRRDPRIAMVIIDPGDPYRYLQIQGRVVEMTKEGAKEHINQLSHKYRGKDYELPAGQERIRIKVLPENVSGSM